ncbi:Heterokaryon incompatibility protein [Apiospora sp. TS-2023a]
MAQPYQHAPLESPDSIRLLDLLPAVKWDAPVKCRIRQVTFERACDKYEALSYVWGALEGDQPITCDCRELLITPNCHDAILHLRRRFRVRTLWIDSICIDQRKAPNSTQERNHQVKQMGVVYQNASRVLVWLGLNTSGLTVNHHRCLRFAYYGDRPQLPYAMYRATHNSDVLDYYYFYDNSPFFTETSKEFAFAKNYTLIWGQLHIKWEYIHFLAEECRPSIATFPQAIPFRSLATFFINKQLPYRERLGNRNLGIVSSPAELRFVLALRFQQSTLNHDKVYGVYAILTTMGIKMPEPDYNKPAESVMDEFTWAYISSRKHLDLITAEISRSNSPTWIPEYIIPSSEIRFRNFGTSSRGRTREDLEYRYRASGCSRAFIAHEKLPGKLVVKGRYVDFVQSRTVCQVIHTTHKNLLEFESFREFIAVCQQWCQTCTKLLQKPEQTVYRTSESLWEAVLGSIKTNHTDSTKVADWFDLMLYPNCSKLSPAEVKKHSRPIDAAEAEYQPGPADIILDYLTHLRTEVDNDICNTHMFANKFVKWAFLITGNSYLGRAYHTCQEGDQLWLLAGSANPVILRQSGSEYQYIAPAYFYGIMEGELWPEDETELETLTLV